MPNRSIADGCDSEAAVPLRTGIGKHAASSLLTRPRTDAVTSALRPARRMEGVLPAGAAAASRGPTVTPQARCFVALVMLKTVGAEC